MSFTRCYMSGSTSAAVSPAFSSGWDKTSDALRRRLDYSRQNTANTSNSSTGDGTANHNILLYQMVGAALAAQTIAGTVKGQFLCQEGSSGIDASSQMRILVVSNDGSTVRGVLLELGTDAVSSEWVVGTNTNRKFPLAINSPASLAPLDIQDGDRLVIEIGARTHGTPTSSLVILLRDNSGSDLPEDETQTTAANSWIEFSDTIYVQGETPPVIYHPLDPFGASGFYGI